MIKYHINNEGNPGVCKAQAVCPFGDEESHYASETLARNAYEEAYEANGWWRPTKASMLKDLALTIKRERADVFELTLEEKGLPLSAFIFRLLPGKLIWPQWRENKSEPGSPPPPKGVHDELQRRVLDLLPGWGMVSNPLELSLSGETFRESFMARNPNVTWMLDKSLESDEGVNSATPAPSAEELQAMLLGTPLQAAGESNL